MFGSSTTPGLGLLKLGSLFIGDGDIRDGFETRWMNNADRLVEGTLKQLIGFALNAFGNCFGCSGGAQGLVFLLRSLDLAVAILGSQLLENASCISIPLTRSLK